MQGVIRSMPSSFSNQATKKSGGGTGKKEKKQLWNWLHVTGPRSQTDPGAIQKHGSHSEARTPPAHQPEPLYGQRCAYARPSSLISRCAAPRSRAGR